MLWIIFKYNNNNSIIIFSTRYVRVFIFNFYGSNLFYLVSIAAMCVINYLLFVLLPSSAINQSINQPIGSSSPTIRNGIPKSPGADGVALSSKTCCGRGTVKDR
jgi:hypothetical protein